MQHEIIARSAASAAQIRLADGETVTCEIGSMIAMSSDINVETTSFERGSKKTGMLKSIKRMFVGESFFLNHFTAIQADQTLLIGPQQLGDIICHPLRATTLIVQGGSWLASTDGIEVDATFQGLGNAMFSGEGIFWIKCTGSGDLFLNSFGAIYEVDVDEEYTVDTGHIVAYEETLEFKVGKSNASVIGSLLGGEGLVCKFTGSGKLYCQSHNPQSFGQALGPKLNPR